MYIRKSTRKYSKDKIYTNYLVVESVHTPKGPRQKVVCSLGDLSPRPRGEWLKLAHKVQDALVGQGNWLEVTDPEVEEIVRKVKARKQRAQRSPTPSEGENRGDELVSVRVDRVTTEQHLEAGPVHVGYHFGKRLDLDAPFKPSG